MKTKCHLSISRVHGGDSDTMRLSLQDSASGEVFVCSNIPLNDFMEALTSEVKEIEVEVRNLDRVGKTRETKIVYYSLLPHFSSPRKRVTNALICAWSLDKDNNGWTVDSSFFNTQAFRKESKSEYDIWPVRLERWVENEK